MSYQICHQNYFTLFTFFHFWTVCACSFRGFSLKTSCISLTLLTLGCVYKPYLQILSLLILALRKPLLFLRTSVSPAPCHACCLSTSHSQPAPPLLILESKPEKHLLGMISFPSILRSYFLKLLLTMDIIIVVV